MTELLRRVQALPVTDLQKTVLIRGLHLLKCGLSREPGPTAPEPGGHLGQIKTKLKIMGQDSLDLKAIFAWFGEKKNTT